jgi:hypothetical protein
MGAPRKLDARRCFSSEQRAVLFLLANGQCQGCGEALGDHWHADHIVPWSAAGRTELTNGQALCAACNLWKGSHPNAGPRPAQRSLRMSAEPVRFAKNNLTRFLARLVATESGCLEWRGKRRPDGYGVCMFEKRWIRVHRFLWEQFNGPVPAGLVLHHRCENRACANHWHLEPCTIGENILKQNHENFGRSNREKTHCAHGHPFDAVHLRYNSRGERFCGTCRSLRKKAKRAAMPKPARKLRPPRATCPQGHPMSGANLYVSPHGERHCRACRAARQKAARNGSIPS